MEQLKMPFRNGSRRDGKGGTYPRVAFRLEGNAAGLLTLSAADSAPEALFVLPGRPRHNHIDCALQRHVDYPLFAG
jgi:hypothetical protein